MGSPASESFKLLLLQYPQQLWLKRQRKIPDFIKEEGPCISHFKSADFLRDRPRKCSLLMAKEFTLQEVKGNRCTIQLYERPPGP